MASSNNCKVDVFLHTHASKDDLNDRNVDTETVSPDEKSNCYQEKFKFNSSGLSSSVVTTTRPVELSLEWGCEVQRLYPPLQTHPWVKRYVPGTRTKWDTVSPFRGSPGRRLFSWAFEGLSGVMNDHRAEMNACKFSCKEFRLYQKWNI